ncbi:MAG: biopolymer transporter ExbD [Gammaproteobacteria bacterium]|nr:biopolymer transporter ExbD [Gammaproteobacteria bacterium]
MAFQGTVLDRRQKQKKVAGLNLVSLMDIFTILVFFLLMNSGDSQEIEKANFITLPDSQATGSFQNELLITIGDDFVSIGDENIVDIKTVEQAKGKSIDVLAQALKAKAAEKGELTEFEQKNGRSVTIMGDQGVPYLILKGVMATCSQENYRDIALAVNQVIGSAIASGGQP